MEREHMFDKVVTPGDVGKLNRLVIPKQHAERYFPLDNSSTNNNKGLLLNFEDRSGNSWRFRYSYWNSSQSYVMTKGWSRFVKDKKLDAGDIVSFQRDSANKDKLYIDWRRRPKIMSKAAEEFVDEVRYSFVSHLSEALRRKGINDVVVDLASDDLLPKVEKARVSVMVLPANCEPTGVCLDNFVMVVERQRNKDQVVVPVLYGESPLLGEWLNKLNLKDLSPIHQSRKDCSDSKLVERIVVTPNL